MTSQRFIAPCSVHPRVEEDDDRARVRMEQLIQVSLCSNCKHLGECAFLPKAFSPLTGCELYECGPSEKPRLTVVKNSGTPAEGLPESDDPLLGLCVNCENTNGCNLARPAGGVWMCEEYC